MQDDLYLSTEEAAAYLRIKERKLYDLAASGAVPCSKVTGRWLFPRLALDQWIAAGLVHPQGFVADPPPPIIGGSHDLLLEWAVRGAGSGLAMLPEGSEAGLERLARNEIAIAAIHLHGPDGRDANVEAVARHAALHDAVLIGFARREQGLLLPSGNPAGIETLGDALARGLRFGLRQKGAGAQLLLARLVSAEGQALEALRAAPDSYPTGHDLALGIRSGEVDCGIATRAVASAQGLGFLPLVWERFDLAMRRRSYFEPGPQALVAAMRKPDLARRAAFFGGYDVSEAGAIRFNR